MARIVLVGASEHARVIADVVEKAGEHVLVGFVDQRLDIGTEVAGHRVLGRQEELGALMQSDGIEGAIVGIGDNHVRARVMGWLSEHVPELRSVTAVHPSAVLGRGVTLGDGTVLMAGVVVNPGTTVGRGCILNTRSSLDHDSVMEDFSSLAPGVVTGGKVRVGRESAIGVGASLIHGVEIGAHTVIGAGAVVVRSIPAKVVAYGCPARVVRPRAEGERYL